MTYLRVLFYNFYFYKNVKFYILLIQQLNISTTIRNFVSKNDLITKINWRKNFFFRIYFFKGKIAMFFKQTVNM